ncbi:MAG: sulfatase-like hydrolase/transferase [Verrucomicrobiota bacterium]
MKRLLFLLLAALAFTVPSSAAPARPNILWLTCEDSSAHIGCYGDKFATTPNIDAIAARGLRYQNAWSCAPVCAPARTTIISGMYPPSTGSEHMRSLVRLPAGMKMYPQYLREAGYYCTNNSKEDYNLEKPGEVWNESSGRAHWKNRQPGQPFFAIFNYTVTHESQARKRPHTPVHDPQMVRVPAYHPDTPEVRLDWAQHYDNVTTMDGMVGKALQELADAGLADDTIVFFYSDHGTGIARSKRWPYNSGLRVPFIVHIPEKFKHLAPKDYRSGGVTERLISFVDLAPTLLSLAGVKPPAHLQGHAFMGAHEAPPQPFIYGFRGRMDERFDLVRTVRDERYVYIRNYMPHKIYGQHVSYMFETPTTRVWKKMHDEGKLNAAQDIFWNTKAPEELYDLQNDPDEVNNLAGSPAHQDVLKRLRQAQQDLALKIRDVGFLPEGEIHSRAEGSTPYDIGHDDAKYPFKRVFETAEAASLLKAAALPQLKKALKDGDSAVRYWGALGILMRGKSGVDKAAAELRAALKDASPYVRVVAAEALGKFGGAADSQAAVAVLVGLAPIDRNGVFVSMAALNALDELDGKAKSALAAIQALPQKAKGVDARMNSYVPRLIEKTVADLQ